MSDSTRSLGDQRGPLRADQLRSGDPYELSNGHPIRCAPTGGRGAGPNQLGASVVGWDPQVREAGVDAGYSTAPNMLRAPDVAVGNVPDRPGWIEGVPDLAIEYADVGQDEDDPRKKVDELLAAGTRFLWVVRLAGPRRVEVHEAGKPMRTIMPGEHLTAPGVLKNPVLVQALYEREEAERATFTNLLQRRGYENLDAVLAQGRAAGVQQGREEGVQQAREEGVQQGREEGVRQGREEGLSSMRTVLRRIFARRDLVLDAAIEQRIDGCRDIEQLQRWIEEATMAKSAHDALDPPEPKR